MENKNTNLKFDVFFFDKEDDLNCYLKVVKLADWSWPCSFLTSDTSSFLNVDTITLQLGPSEENLKLYIIIDNTPFPTGYLHTYYPISLYMIKEIEYY